MNNYYVQAVYKSGLITVAENVSEIEAHRLCKQYEKENHTKPLYIECFVSQRIL